MKRAIVITAILSSLAACGGASGGDEDTANAAPDADGLADSDVAVCSCDGVECGTNACGDVCGTCPAAAPYCYDGMCAVDCRPECAGKLCGPDGCGGVCGSCGVGEVCEEDQCVCSPSCEGYECGDDGCGGSCGSCPQAAPYCVSHACVVECSPSCEGKACGDDGCGGSCGDCGGGSACVAGACATCGCGDRECGAGPCLESCGTCSGDAPYCIDGRCETALSCPTAVIAIEEGVNVAPMTSLHLSAAGSSANHGTVAHYHWTSIDPFGVERVFSANESPTLEVDLVGDYVLRLTVVDSEGEESCAPAETVVHVVPDETLHVEVRWSNASAGNADLHFAHPFATGGYDGDGDDKPDGWFDGQFDCFWFNHDPNWGSLDPAIDDDPSLVLGSAFGPSPEILRMNSPESDLTYKIGVHARDTYVAVEVTVRVFINGGQVFTDTTTLGSDDMWTAAFVDWPSGKVRASRVCTGTTTPCENDQQCPYACGYQIVRDYNHPFFP